MKRNDLKPGTRVLADLDSDIELWRAAYLHKKSFSRSRVYIIQKKRPGHEWIMDENGVETKLILYSISPEDNPRATFWIFGSMLKPECMFESWEVDDGA